MDSGLTSSRTDAFPAGLRVLVVDDDLAWLRILEKMLKKCSYEVTTCCLAREALDLLRERKDGFDIVISDVNMPDMDGFKLLEHVGLEMDLPVIMMSVDGETSRVMRGVQHGACDYLLKPIRMKELRNIWQHVLRKRIHEHEGSEEIQMMMRHGLDQFDDGLFLSAGELVTGKRKKDAESKHDEREYGDPSSVKKTRVVWTVDLHQKFVNAFNQIGFDKVGPKKILDLMNVPWLTRENVASHLQKYRLYLIRLQKENEQKASFGGSKQSDLSANDPTGILGLHNSISGQQNNGICATSSNDTLIQSGEPKFLEGDLESIVSFPIQEPKKALAPDIPEPPKASCSRVSLSHSFRPLKPDIKYSPFGPTMNETYLCNDLPKSQFKKENGFDQMPQPSPDFHFPVDHGQFAPYLSPKQIKTEIRRPRTIEMKPHCIDNRNQQLRETAQIREETNLLAVPVHGATSLVPVDVSEPLPSTSSSTRAKNLNQFLEGDLGLSHPDQLSESYLDFATSDGDLFSCLPQSHNYKANIEVLFKEPQFPNYPELFEETTAQWFDPQRVDYEYPWESIEYPVIDQGLFII